MHTMIRTVIVDDEPWAIDLMKSYIARIPHLELVYASDNAVSVINYLATEKADLLFLDIQMPEVTGIDMMEIIDKDARIIVTTAYSEYALQTYEHNIIDYLLKPIGFNRFYKAVQRATELIELTQRGYAGKAADPAHNFIFVKTDGKLVKLFYDEILFVEALKDYIAIQTLTDKIISLDSLTNMERLLPANLFCRIHRSFIASIGKIESVERSRVFIKAFALPIGEVYKESFMRMVIK
jgi:DNA-binding LytR/AlgR family response regulator